MIDDYLLGKDNTPIPRALPAYQDKVHLQETWSVVAGKPYKIAAYLKLKPVIQGAYLYTASTSGIVEAIDKNTGKIRWSQIIKSGINSGPRVSSRDIALGTNASSVILLDKNDGHIRWETKVSGDVLAKPLIYNGKVIVKTVDGNLYGLN